jgi:hypothetical protein
MCNNHNHPGSAAHRPPIGRRIGCSVRPARISRGTVRRDFAKLERRGEK